MPLSYYKKNKINRKKTQYHYHVKKRKKKWLKRENEVEKPIFKKWGRGEVIINGRLTTTSKILLLYKNNEITKIIKNQLL